MNVGSRRLAQFGLLLLAVILFAVLQWQGGREPARPEVSSESRVSAESVERAFAERASGVWVEVEGRVNRILSDDLRGSRHQRFILELPSGQTLLVAHNIDLAPKVPLKRGDRVSIHGEYEWNDRGGVVHWTHHDPDGRRDGGWIRHDDRLYE